LLIGPTSEFHRLLKKLRKSAGFKSAIAFSEQVGVHKNTQGLYERSGDPKIDYLVAFSCLTKVPFWQLIAQRIMMGRALDTHKHQVLNEIGPLFSQVNEQSGDYFVNLEQTDEAIANFNASQVSADTSDIISVCQHLLSANLNESAIKVFKQSGNSMSPTINEGDTLFVNTAAKLLSDGDLFLVTLGQVHTIKRIQLLPNGGIILLSDNGQYQPINLACDDIGELNIQGKLMTTISQYG
jgi:SOS-response transcriptional repressor LexA